MEIATFILLALSLLVSATALIVSLTNGSRKREIKWQFEPASKADFEKHIEVNHHEHEGLHSKIGGVERGADAKLEAKFKLLMDSSDLGRARLHERINPIVENTAEIKGQMVAFTQSFDNFTKIVTHLMEEQGKKS